MWMAKSKQRDDCVFSWEISTWKREVFEYFIIQLAHFIPSKQLDFLLSSFVSVYLYSVHLFKWIVEQHVPCTKPFLNLIMAVIIIQPCFSRYKNFLDLFSMILITSAIFLRLFSHSCTSLLKALWRKLDTMFFNSNTLQSDIYLNSLQRLFKIMCITCIF